MIIEHAELTVDPVRAAGFEDAFERGVGHLARADGFHWARLLRGIERQGTYVLLVGWDSVEAHTVGFRASELFAAWRAEVGPYFAGTPAVEHYAELSFG